MREFFRRLAARNAAILAGRVARAAGSKGFALAVDDDQTPEPVAAVVTAPANELMAVAEHFDVDPRPTVPVRPYATGGWSLAGTVKVHRACAEGYRVCAACAGVLSVQGSEA